MKRKITLAALLGAVAFSGYAVGQNDRKSQIVFLDAWTKTIQNPSDTGPLLDAYAKMPGNAAMTKQAAALGFDAARGGNNGPLLTSLVMQNQKIIEQNAQIAALLSKIAAKK